MNSEWISIADYSWHVLSEARKICTIMSHLSGEVLAHEETMAQFLSDQQAWHVQILKRPRENWVNDSYILNITVGKEKIGIKIHKDVFAPCKAIYEDAHLLNQLIIDRDIPSVLHSMNQDGWRIVIYKWEKGENPANIIKQSPEKITTIEQSLRKRISSIWTKGLTLRTRTERIPGPEDFLLREEVLILLDTNKLYKVKTDIPPCVQAEKIIEDWKRRIEKALD